MEAQEGKKMALRSLDNALPATAERPKKILKVMAPEAKISAPSEVPRGPVMNDENAAPPPPPKAVQQSSEYVASEDLKALPDPETKITMNIFLKLMKTVALEVNRTYTIDDIKAKISAVERFATNQQELFFEGNYLKGPDVLADYNIPENSTIKVYIGDGMQIFVRTPTMMPILLDVKKYDTIQDVKAKIQEKVGIPPSKQTLVYVGRSLEDNQTLIPYDIKKGSLHNLVLRPKKELHIFVNRLMVKT